MNKRKGRRWGRGGEVRGRGSGGCKGRGSKRDRGGKWRGSKRGVRGKGRDSEGEREM